MIPQPLCIKHKQIKARQLQLSGIANQCTDLSKYRHRNFGRLSLKGTSKDKITFIISKDLDFNNKDTKKMITLFGYVFIDV